MATEKFSNDPVTTLNGGLGALDLSAIVTDATKFPPNPQFRIKIDAEIIIVTGVAGATFTITRGAEGTLAASHADGASVTHILTAGALEQLKLDIVTPISESIPDALIVGGSGSAGSATTVSASDHVHPMPAFGNTSGTFCQGDDPRFSAIVLLAGVNSQGVATPTRVGSRQSTVTQTMTLGVQLEATAGTAHARLWDVTASASVAEVSTSNTTSTRLTSAGLAIVASHLYELQVWLVGGAPPTDRAIITYGELV